MGLFFDFVDEFDELDYKEENFLKVAEYIDNNVYYICADARGLDDNEISVNVENNIILLEYHKKEPLSKVHKLFADEMELPLTGGFKFKFNNIIFDPNTIKATLDKGLLIIQMETRSEMKPVKKTIKIGLN